MCSCTSRPWTSSRLSAGSETVTSHLFLMTHLRFLTNPCLF